MLKSFTPPSQQSQHNFNLWIIPLKMSLVAVLLFALTMIPDTLAAYNVIHLPTCFTMGSIDDARAILSAMMGCVSTVLALIFFVALLLLSMVASKEQLAANKENRFKSDRALMSLELP